MTHTGCNFKGFNSFLCLWVYQSFKRGFGSTKVTIITSNPHKCIIFISNFHYEIIAFFIFPSVARVRAKCCTKYPKLMLKTSQLWMPCPQDPIFQHLLEPETGIEGAIKIAKKFQRPCMLNKTPRFTLKASKLRMPWPRIPFSNNLVSQKV